MLLREAFARTVRCYPEQPAVVTDDGRTVTYERLDEAPEGTVQVLLSYE